MCWVRNNWLVVVLLAAISLSFWASHVDSQRSVRAALVASRHGCERDANDRALNAAFARLAAKARRESGDTETARAYDGLANGLLMTIPAPPGLRGRPEMGTVKRVMLGGKPIFVLTPETKALQSEGCRLSYR